MKQIKNTFSNESNAEQETRATCNVDIFNGYFPVLKVITIQYNINAVLLSTQTFYKIARGCVLLINSHKNWQLFLITVCRKIIVL